MIVLCVVSFLVFPAGRHEESMLDIGAGIHPVQWLTNIFMHAGPGHLVGNMIFLWAFGIIVEGKLGWWAFTLAYLAIGIAESAGIQLAMHPAEPVHMLGASGAIYGLLAMCVVWCRKNELHCVAFFRFFPTDFDFSILWFVGFYVGLEFVEFGLSGFRISGAMAHLAGASLASVSPSHCSSSTWSTARTGTFSP